MVTDVQHVLLSSMLFGGAGGGTGYDVMFVREQIYYLYCVNMVRQDI